jgi:hypothetical protein
MDLSPLYEHGDLKVVLPVGDSPTNHPDQSYCLMEERLATFDPEKDYLVWAAGDVLAAVMVGMILVNMEEPIWKFNWLRYERARLPDGTRTHEGARYVPVLIDLEDPQFDLLDKGQYDEEYDDDEFEDEDEESAKK